MLCYRCGSHVPDTAETCSNCGQRLDAGGRMPGATSMRKRPGPGELAGAPFKVGDTIGARYEVKDSVGAGPLGFVLKCHDRELDVHVALKLIHPRLAQSPEERSHFTEVMQGARKFGHPSLARVYDEGVLEQGWLFYTQPFLDGFTLRKIIDLKLAKGQLFTLREVLPILSQLVAALEGKSLKSAHGDLKPSNVVLQPDLLKVTDYGLALALPRRPFVQAQKPNLAHRYLAPEYVAGFEVDARADQYSLGVIIGEMLSGLFPEGNQLPQLRSKNPDLEPAVEGFYRKALSERADGRFAHGNELLEEFKALGASLFSNRTRPEPMPSPEALDRDVPPVPEPEERTELESRKNLGLREAPRAESAPAPQSADSPAEETIPPDATQPVSAEELARHLAEKPIPPGAGHPSSAPPPLPSSPPAPPLMTPPPAPMAHGRGESLVAVPVPSAPMPSMPRAAPGEFPTQAWQSILSEAPPAPAMAGGLFAASRKSSAWDQPGLKLVAQCFAAVVVGALAGWLFLSHVEKPAPASVSLTPDAPATPAGSSVGGGSPQPAPAPAPPPSVPSPAPSNSATSAPGRPAAEFPRVISPAPTPAHR